MSQKTPSFKRRASVTETPLQDPFLNSQRAPESRGLLATELSKFAPNTIPNEPSLESREIHQTISYLGNQDFEFDDAHADDGENDPYGHLLTDLQNRFGVSSQAEINIIDASRHARIALDSVNTRSLLSRPSTGRAKPPSTSTSDTASKSSAVAASSIKRPQTARPGSVASNLRLIYHPEGPLPLRAYPRLKELDSWAHKQSTGPEDHSNIDVSAVWMDSETMCNDGFEEMVLNNQGASRLRVRQVPVSVQVHHLDANAQQDVISRDGDVDNTTRYRRSGYINVKSRPMSAKGETTKTDHRISENPNVDALSQLDILKESYEEYIQRSQAPFLYNTRPSEGGGSPLHRSDAILGTTVYDEFEYKLLSNNELMNTKVPSHLRQTQTVNARRPRVNKNQTNSLSRPTSISTSSPVKSTQTASSSDEHDVDFDTNVFESHSSESIVRLATQQRLSGYARQPPDSQPTKNGSKGEGPQLASQRTMRRGSNVVGSVSVADLMMSENSRSESRNEGRTESQPDNQSDLNDDRSDSRGSTNDTPNTNTNTHDIHSIFQPSIPIPPSYDPLSSILVARPYEDEAAMVWSVLGVRVPRKTQSKTNQEMFVENLNNGDVDKQGDLLIDQEKHGLGRVSSVSSYYKVDHGRLHPLLKVQDSSLSFNMNLINTYLPFMTLMHHSYIAVVINEHSESRRSSLKYRATLASYQDQLNHSKTTHSSNRSANDSQDHALTLLRDPGAFLSHLENIYVAKILNTNNDNDVSNNNNSIMNNNTNNRSVLDLSLLGISKFLFLHVVIAVLCVSDDYNYMYIKALKALKPFTKKRSSLHRVKSARLFRTSVENNTETTNTSPFRHILPSNIPPMSASLVCTALGLDDDHTSQIDWEALAGEVEEARLLKWKAEFDQREQLVLERKRYENEIISRSTNHTNNNLNPEKKQDKRGSVSAIPNSSSTTGVLTSNTVSALMGTSQVVAPLAPHSLLNPFDLSHACVQRLLLQRLGLLFNKYSTVVDDKHHNTEDRVNGGKVSTLYVLSWSQFLESLINEIKNRVQTGRNDRHYSFFRRHDSKPNDNDEDTMRQPLSKKSTQIPQVMSAYSLEASDFGTSVSSQLKRPSTSRPSTAISRPSTAATSRPSTATSRPSRPSTARQVSEGHAVALSRPSTVRPLSSRPPSRPPSALKTGSTCGGNGNVTNTVGASSASLLQSLKDDRLNEEFMTKVNQSDDVKTTALTLNSNLSNGKTSLYYKNILDNCRNSGMILPPSMNLTCKLSIGNTVAELLLISNPMYMYDMYLTYSQQHLNASAVTPSSLMPLQSKKTKTNSVKPSMNRVASVDEHFDNDDSNTQSNITSNYTINELNLPGLCLVRFKGTSPIQLWNTQDLSYVCSLPTEPSSEMIQKQLYHERQVAMQLIEQQILNRNEYNTHQSNKISKAHWTDLAHSQGIKNSSKVNKLRAKHVNILQNKGGGGLDYGKNVIIRKESNRTLTNNNTVEGSANEASPPLVLSKDFKKPVVSGKLWKAMAGLASIVSIQETKHISKSSVNNIRGVETKKSTKNLKDANNSKTSRLMNVKYNPKSVSFFRSQLEAYKEAKRANDLGGNHDFQEVMIEESNDEDSEDENGLSSVAKSARNKINAAVKPTLALVKTNDSILRHITHSNNFQALTHDQHTELLAYCKAEDEINEWLATQQQYERDDMWIRLERNDREKKQRQLELQRKALYSQSSSASLSEVESTDYDEKMKKRYQDYLDFVEASKIKYGGLDTKGSKSGLSIKPAPMPTEKKFRAHGVEIDLKRLAHKQKPNVEYTGMGIYRGPDVCVMATVMLETDGIDSNKDDLYNTSHKNNDTRTNHSNNVYPTTYNMSYTGGLGCIVTTSTDTIGNHVNFYLPSLTRQAAQQNTSVVRYRLLPWEHQAFKNHVTTSFNSSKDSSHKYGSSGLNRSLSPLDPFICGSKNDVIEELDDKTPAISHTPQTRISQTQTQTPHTGLNSHTLMSSSSSLSSQRPSSRVVSSVMPSYHHNYDLVFRSQLFYQPQCMHISHPFLTPDAPSSSANTLDIRYKHLEPTSNPKQNQHKNRDEGIDGEMRNIDPQSMSVPLTPWLSSAHQQQQSITLPIFPQPIKETSAVEQLLIGDSNGNLYVHNFNESMKVKSITQAHTGPITKILTHPCLTYSYLSSSLDSTISITDAHTGYVVRFLGTPTPLIEQNLASQVDNSTWNESLNNRVRPKTVNSVAKEIEQRRATRAVDPYQIITGKPSLFTTDLYGVARNGSENSDVNMKNNANNESATSYLPPWAADNVTGHLASVMHIDYSSRYKSIVSAGLDKKVLLWDLHAMHPTAEIKSSNTVTSLIVNDASHQLILVTSMNTINIYDLRTNGLLQSLQKNIGNISTAAVDQHTQRLVLGGDNKLTVWPGTQSLSQS